MNRLQILKVATQVLPFILSVVSITHSILYFLLDLEGRVFSIVGGVGIIVLLYLWLASWCFRFCFHQKVFLYYLTIVQLTNIIDEYYSLPINNYWYYSISYITFGCTIIMYAILKFKENAKLKHFNQTDR